MTTPKPAPMFPSGDDLPLFSGTPQRAQVEQFKPEAVEEQPTLFPLPQPEMGRRRRPIAPPPKIETVFGQTRCAVTLPRKITRRAVEEAERWLDDTTE